MSRSVVTIKTGGGKAGGGEEYEFRVDRSTFTIGRSAICDLALPSPAVSFRHAEIRTATRDGVRVIDLGSKNGTFVEGERIAPHRPVAVNDRDEIRIANVSIRIRPYEPADDSESLSLDTSHSLSRVLLRGMLGEAIRQNRAYFQVLKGPAAGARLVIDESTERALIGAGPQVQLDLEEPALAESPIHVVLTGQTYCVVPVDGVPLRINRDPVTATRQLRSGDKLRVLKSVILFSDPLQDAVDELERLDDADTATSIKAQQVSSSDVTETSSASRPRVTAFEGAVFGLAVATLLASVLFLLYVLGVLA